MAPSYSEIIKIRSGKAAYNIGDEKADEWRAFIPNKQFNEVLNVVLRSVQNNDIDVHKSFWLNGTYGTGKSHAVSVISHLLGDPIEDIRDWVDYEYGDARFESYRANLYSLREKKRLLTVNIYGLSNIETPSDLAPVLQKAVVTTLERHRINMAIPTDFDNIADHIQEKPKFWNDLIEGYVPLQSIVTDAKELTRNLRANDFGTYHRVIDALREARYEIRLKNEDITQWLIEVQNKLVDMGTYDGLLIIWDEFTDVASSASGIQILKGLQKVVERFMSEENNSYMFLISHPNALDIKNEEYQQTVGRYHKMKYNMESVSAFRIMSRKFEIVDRDGHRERSLAFYDANPNLPSIYSATSNDQTATEEDLRNLYPLHPGTANLATHYATVIGSSSRSVFEFLGQNDAIREFLQDEAKFFNHELITADYLWDYVWKGFQEDTKNYSAVTERYHTYIQRVEKQGEAYAALFKSILLLNAFNNVSGENNNGLVTPSEENIRNLIAGTQYEESVSNILQWFGDQGIIQRAPGGLYSVQFSALPAGEIEEAKRKMREVEFKNTQQILRFSDEISSKAAQLFLSKVLREYEFGLYSDLKNETMLKHQIKSARKKARSSRLYFALLFARNREELSALHNFCQNCSAEDDAELKNIVFAVFEEVLTEKSYDEFIEYQANRACAESHNLSDRVASNRTYSVELIKEWLGAAQRSHATLYLNSEEKKQISAKRFSSEINESITSKIFTCGLDVHKKLRQVPSTFWRTQNSKDIVRKFLTAITRTDIEDGAKGAMAPIKYLVQDCLNDDLTWKAGVPKSHPLYAVCEKVKNIISRSDKSLTFNFDDKFSILASPPYGLSSNFASMAAMAFALRPWRNKIFDMQGRPRDASGMADDISALFKVWDEGRANSKLNFKFQTKEEGKLCKDLITLFNLSGSGNTYTDISSLKDARYAITSDFLAAKQSPLWALKYVPQDFFSSLLGSPSISAPMCKLIDNIVRICSADDVRNPALLQETLDLIAEVRIDMQNVLNLEGVFKAGLKNFLLQVEKVSIKDEDIDSVIEYIAKHLQSTIGYWTEDEVRTRTKDWYLDQLHTTPPSDGTPTAGESGSNTPNEPNTATTSHSPKTTEKRERAKKRIGSISSIDEARAILYRLCEQGDERILDEISDWPSHV